MSTTWDASHLEGIIKKHDADRYYKAFKAKTQLITMLFGILSRCDSMGEICEGLRAMQGKLNHLGLKSSPAWVKNTAEAIQWMNNQKRLVKRV